jgi:hypothetical protein
MANFSVFYDVEDQYHDPVPPNDAWGKYLSMRFAQRPAFYESLEPSEKELIRKEVQRIKYFRENFETQLLSPSRSNALSASLAASRSTWRKAALLRCKEELKTWDAKIANCKDTDFSLKRQYNIISQVQLWESKEYSKLQNDIAPESYIHDLDLQTSSMEDNPDESNYGYNGWMIVFEKGKGGVTVDHPLCHGHFPNQKISIQQLLYNKSQTPLKRTESNEHLRYFHLPANNMKWVEVRTLGCSLVQNFRLLAILQRKLYQDTMERIYQNLTRTRC